MTFNERDLPAFEDFSLEISAVQVRCFTWRLPRNRALKRGPGHLGGLAGISGFYQRGSAGSDDALHIS